MKVFIFGRTINDEQVSTIRGLLKTLQREGAQVAVYYPYSDLLAAKVGFLDDYDLIRSTDQLRMFGPDFAFTLGGDGTMLSAALIIKDTGIPVIGINLGRLGFLASIEQKHIDRALTELKHKRYSLESRSLISLDSNLPLFEDANFALNDFTILKRDNSSMIIIHTYLNGEFLNSYWADGLIVSTPTGSTGYSLSCGGPIVFPESRSLVITPVAPHNLNVRPIIIPDDSTISFKVEGRTDNFLCTLDSRSEIITDAYELSIRKCDFLLSLVRLEGMSFSRTMRSKLLWGHDMRKFS
ncbi:MAG: NAD kinase [Saprospiraceae bacterium]|nr:NAD kinase [Saprospiraceae bacterium]